jgi:8-hydroxy-5-deazaflavin:NADPH oxidoreductase
MMKTRRVPDLHRRDVLKAAAAVIAAGSLPLATRLAAARGARAVRIGMIGSGRVGSALGRVWAHAGHEVMFSSLDLDHDKKLAADVGANARAGTPREAAAFGQVLVFAVPYSALPDLGKTLDGLLKDKVVIDACNPFPSRDGAIANEALAKGAGMESAELLPGARIVRAFNAIGAETMGEAHEQPGRVGMPIAGDKRAIDVASRLIREIGYEPVIVGGLDMGKYLRPGTPLSGEHSPDDIRKIAATLKP